MLGRPCSVTIRTAPARNARRERELEAEVRALRKKLAEKDEVIELLKKSIGIISKP